MIVGAVTSASIKEVMARMRATFRAEAVPIEEGSSLTEALDELNWLSSWGHDPFSNRGAHEQDPDRTRNALFLYEALHRVEGVLSKTDGLDGRRAVLRRMKSIASCPDKPTDGQGWDRFFEIETVSHLRGRAQDVRLDERTDIVLVDAYGNEFDLACKRPRSAGAIERNVGKAAQQIATARCVTGGVAISLDLCTPRYVVPQEGDVFATPAEFQAACTSTLESLARQFTDSIQAGLGANPRVIGCVLIKRFNGLTKDPCTLAWSTVWSVVPQVDGDSRLLETIMGPSP